MIYARIYENKVAELFETDDDITQMFHPDLIWVDITNLDPQPGERWNYVDGVFTPPTLSVRTPEMIHGENVLRRDYFLGVAALAIAPLQDAVDLDMATEEEVAALRAWKLYRIAVNRVILSVDSIVWPDFPPQYYSWGAKTDVDPGQ